MSNGYKPWLIGGFSLLLAGRLASIARWHHALRSTGASAHIEATALSLCARDWFQLRALILREAALGRARVIEAWFHSGAPQARVRVAARHDAILALDLAEVLANPEPAAASPRADRLDLRCAAIYAALDCALSSFGLMGLLHSFGLWDAGGLGGLAAAMLARIAGSFTPGLGGFGPRELLLAFTLGASRGVIASIASTGMILLALHVCDATWGAIAATRMRHARKQRGDSPAATRISVIIPTFNEELALRETVDWARRIPEVGECIVVDGGSSDRTREIAAELGCVLLTSPPGRGRQLRLGADLARHPVVMLLHADTWLPPEAGAAVHRCLADPRVVAGGFWKRFRDRPRLLIGSRPKCLVRVLIGRRIVGDMACFIRKDALEAIGGVPDMELMEDFALSARLRRAGRLALADATVTTSARRFRKHGVVATYWKMWRVTWLYRFGTSPSDLRKIYQTCTESDSKTSSTKPR